MLALILVFGFVWGFLAMSIATKKHRDGFGWFFAGFFFGLVGVLIAFVASPLPDPNQQGQLSAWG